MSLTNTLKQKDNDIQASLVTLAMTLNVIIQSEQGLSTMTFPPFQYILRSRIYLPPLSALVEAPESGRHDIQWRGSRAGALDPLLDVSGSHGLDRGGGL